MTKAASLGISERATESICKKPAWLYSASQARTTTYHRARQSKRKKEMHCCIFPGDRAMRSKSLAPIFRDTSLFLLLDHLVIWWGYETTVAPV